MKAEKKVFHSPILERGVERVNEKVLFVLFMTSFGCSTFQRAELSSYSYVELCSIDPDGKITSESTGLIISPSRVLCCLHCSVGNQKLGIHFGEGIVVGEMVYCDLGKDICILDFGANIFFTKSLDFAEPKVGEELSTFSNTFGIGRIYQKSIVSKVTSNSLYFVPAVAGGSSGSAWFNTSGQIVGMVSMIISDSKGGTVGIAILGSDLKKAIEASKHVRMRFF